MDHRQGHFVVDLPGFNQDVDSARYDDILHNLVATCWHICLRVRLPGNQDKPAVALFSISGRSGNS